jgi:hypothetical protein
MPTVSDVFECGGLLSAITLGVFHPVRAERRRHS